jgi:hypothetical protein
VINPETGAAAQPDEIGVVVARPFYLYCNTPIALRHETGDVARTPSGPLTRRLRHLPAAKRLLGKRFSFRRTIHGA